MRQWQAVSVKDNSVLYATNKPHSMWCVKHIVL